ncbi:MAG: 50S ribosomal protein L30 [candidate division WOR-3 bacterium]|nr:50S ribosomal protein L30 [candidate division WOR-3 bacterium]MCX7947460.1 50S ribosomal protein L30 [candidate division WOR-3 bacterium]MDW8150619.1 50S ribosomal protein L30 [candidate division WOR-3 bacterium]
MKKLKITLTRSLIGVHGKNKEIIKSLGLRKINQAVIKTDNPAIRGMIEKIRQYIKVEEVVS